jgi:hypothetical protein
MQKQLQEIMEEDHELYIFDRDWTQTIIFIKTLLKQENLDE